MDHNLLTVIRRRMDRTAIALQHNGFDARVVEDEEAFFALLPQFLPDGGTWSMGDSVTLHEIGLLDTLSRRNYIFLDPTDPDVDVDEVYRRAKSCDCYFMSSNAVTESGELYNIDSKGNRISALLHGPKRVVVVAGSNKIVGDLETARKRVWEIAAPANGVRLNTTDINTMCSHELVSRRQTVKMRIAVLLLPGRYGY